MIYLRLYEDFINGSTASNDEEIEGATASSEEQGPIVEGPEPTEEGGTASGTASVPIIPIHSDDPEIELLLDLTRIIIPSGKEELIYDVVKENCHHPLEQDDFGNLHCTIGNNRLLFTAHLDSVGKKDVQVNQIMEDGVLKTDEKTILGGDNKTGCAILINMINHNIPGTYYFFVQEEIGRFGSESLNSHLEENKFNFCIAFDRKEISSIITHQRGVKLCNDELSDFLVAEFSRGEYPFRKDPTGMSCDTYTFHDKINNCLNMSSGVYFEHTKSEKIDLDFYKFLMTAVLHIDWEEVERLSEDKDRRNLTTSDIGVENPIIKEVLDFFIDNGYFPNKSPKFREDLRIYRSENIKDGFHIEIDKTGLIKIFNIRCSKEWALDFITKYKMMFFKFKVKNNEYQVIDVDVDALGTKWITLRKNGKKVVYIEVLKKLVFVRKKIQDFEEIINIIYKHIKANDVWWFKR